MGILWFLWGTPAYCLDGGTEVTILGKEHIYKKPVSEVKEGEYVLTYNGKDLIYSEVKENTKFILLKLKIKMKILKVFL